MNVLILKPSSLGDVVQALPVLRMLKRHNAGWNFHWWIDAGLAPLLEGDPDLAGIIPFHRKQWYRPAIVQQLIQGLRHARGLRFDLVIDLQGLARSGVFSWLVHGSRTIGLADAREGASALHDEVVAIPGHVRHAVARYLLVLDHLQVPRRWDFDWLPIRPAVAASIDKKWLNAASRWIALQPGARWPNKCWPTENFVALAKTLSADFPDRGFLVLGSKADQAHGRTIHESVGDRCLDLTGETSLPEMVEIIRRCELFITNDTGPMHVAAALERPVVALFGPTDPQRTGPHGSNGCVLTHPLPCAPCLKPVCHNAQPLECLRLLTPECVARHAGGVLSNGNCKPKQEPTSEIAPASPWPSHRVISTA